MGRKRQAEGAHQREAVVATVDAVRVTRSMLRTVAGSVAGGGSGATVAAVAAPKAVAAVRAASRATPTTAASPRRRKQAAESALPRDILKAGDEVDTMDSDSHKITSPAKRKIGVFRTSDGELRLIPKQGGASSKRVGAHMSAAGCVGNAPRNARSIGASAFAFFTRSQRRWDSPQYSQEEIDDFKGVCRSLEYTPSCILPHGSYLINAGSPDPESRAKSRAALLDEVRRCEQLGLALYNFHPGSTVGHGTVDECLTRIAESIDMVHGLTKGVTLVIENMAGQGSCVGRTFEEIRGIIDRVSDKSRVGVCIDTCHAFAGGYDLSSPAACERTFAEFERTVGFKYLKGLHLNDSKGAVDCRKDRHENIGKGKIGNACFEFVMNDSRFNDIPMVLETPAGGAASADGDGPGTPRPSKGTKDAEQAFLDVYKREIALLYSMEKRP
eukprot:Opistho-2@46072